MASMTTEFYKVKLIRTNNKQEINYKLIEEIFESIFEKYAVDNGNYRSLDLSPNVEPSSVDPKEIMDIFEDDKYLFGRLVRKKANNALQKRNYNTLEAESIFNNNEILERGIESFTFFILDYAKGVLSVVNTKGAPNIRAFNALCERYSKDYELEFESVPNEDGIAVLYGAKTPEISKLEFEIPAPNAEFLQSVLGLDEEVIKEMIQDSVYSSVITLKATPYHKLLSNKEKVKAVLDILIKRKKNYSKALVRGNAENFGSRDFDLRAKYFTYPIEIKKYRRIQGRQVEYSLSELAEQYKNGLHMAYESNYDIITAIINRSGDDVG